MRRAVLVADIGINHEGRISEALALIDACADAGIDMVKFQKRNVEQCYTDEYLNCARESRWGSTVRDEKLGLEFGKEEFDQIDARCREKGIPWFASPRDPESVEFLMQYKPMYMKIASGCQTHMELLEAVKETELPVVMSTGMASHGELGEAAHVLWGRLQYVLHCVSLYPTPRQKMNLRAMRSLRELWLNVCGMRYVRVGYSGHTRHPEDLIDAMKAGAEMVEFHVTRFPEATHGDHQASIYVHDLPGLHKASVDVAVALGDGHVGASEEEIAKGRNYRWRASS